MSRLPLVFLGVLVLAFGIWRAVAPRWQTREGGEASTATSRGSTLPLSVLFLRPLGDGAAAEALLRRQGQAGPRTLFYLANTWLFWPQRSLFGPAPDAVGVLPSPKGEWVLSWENTGEMSEGRPVTEWKAVRLSDGKAVPLAYTPVNPLEGISVFPHWVGDNVVALEGPEGTICSVDVSKPLTAPNDRAKGLVVKTEQEHGAAAGRTLRYLERYYGGHMQRCDSALSRLKGVLETEWERGGAVERERWACALGLGVPLPPSIRRVKWPGAELSVSPDGRLLARADLGARNYVTREFPTWAGEIQGARLDVIDVGSGDRLWAYEVFPRAIEYPTGVPLSTPPAPLWTSTTIGDVRWSADSGYLSFTLHHDPRHKPAVPSAHVLDTHTWQEAMSIVDAADAFVLPLPRGYGD